MQIPDNDWMAIQEPLEDLLEDPAQDPIVKPRLHGFQKGMGFQPPSIEDDDTLSLDLDPDDAEDAVTAEGSEETGIAASTDTIPFD